DLDDDIALDLDVRDIGKIRRNDGATLDNLAHIFVPLQSISPTAHPSALIGGTDVFGQIGVVPSSPPPRRERWLAKPAVAREEKFTPHSPPSQPRRGTARRSLPRPIPLKSLRPRC